MEKTKIYQYSIIFILRNFEGLKNCHLKSGTTTNLMENSYY